MATATGVHFMPALGLTLLLLVALLAREGTTLELPVQEKWTYWSNARLVRYEKPPFPPSLSLSILLLLLLLLSPSCLH